MGWNHRVIVNKDITGELYYGVHEVYYDEKGKPHSITKEAVNVVSDTASGIKWSLKHMKKALKNPVLIGWKENGEFLKEFKKPKKEKK